MSNELTRRQAIFGAAATMLLGNQAQAQYQDHTIDTYPYSADGIFSQVGFRRAEMDVGLLHPETGGPTIGFYASLDLNHGVPFGNAWKNTYRKFIKEKSVFDADQGTLIQIANHIGIHAVTAQQLADAYYTAKETWDQRPDLRVASAINLESRDVGFG